MTIKARPIPDEPPHFNGVFAFRKQEHQNTWQFPPVPWYELPEGVWAPLPNGWAWHYPGSCYCGVIELGSMEDRDKERVIWELSGRPYKPGHYTHGA